MSQSHYFYFDLPIKTLEGIVNSFQEEFDQQLKDNFTDDELLKFEKYIDTIAAVWVQPIITELTFDDFYPHPEKEDEQRIFFERCQSSIAIEHLPYFENNPLQVSYLQDLLGRFENVLIDRGGVNELVFKEQYLKLLAGFKNIDSLLMPVKEKINDVKTSKPIDPIDFLIMDVYLELGRLAGISLPIDQLSEKTKKIFSSMQGEKQDSLTLFRKTGLNAKDFDDGLEKLKFWLRKF